MAATNDTFEPLKLSEFCDRIQVDEREVRYALARGIVPTGMRKTPGRGHHRQFNAHQSFWMSIVLRLKAAGIKTPLAGEIAKWSERARGYAVNLNWDRDFSPCCLSQHSGLFARVLATCGLRRWNRGSWLARSRVSGDVAGLLQEAGRESDVAVSSFSVI